MAAEAPLSQGAGLHADARSAQGKLDPATLEPSPLAEEAEAHLHQLAALGLEPSPLTQEAQAHLRQLAALGLEPSPLTQEAQAHLHQLAALGLERRVRLVSGPQGPEVLLDGRRVILLCSNNYLGLASHQVVCDAAAEAAHALGTGSGASRLISGTMEIHSQLERSLAEFVGTEACLLFGSGYLANIGVISALARRGDVIFSDQLNHASIIDGCRLSGAQVRIYRHLDVSHLESLLQEETACEEHSSGRRRIIVTDSLFSMDGDLAPLPQLVALAQRHRAVLIVDEAHAIGALAPLGRGAVAEARLTRQVDVLIGTLGKALGSYGAYACGSSPLIHCLLNTARSLIFSTAPPPPAIAAASAALQLLRSEPQLVRDLASAAKALRLALRENGFAVAESDVHIVPLLVGGAEDALALCQAALERGVFAQAIRPPTVPQGTSRLRLSVMSSHTPAQMQLAAAVLRQAALAVGLAPQRVGEPSQGLAPRR